MSTAAIRALNADMRRQQEIIEALSVQMREQERLNIYHYLKVQHDDTLWPHNVMTMIAAHFAKGDRLVSFLKAFGYARRGRTFQYTGARQLDVPNFTVRDSMSIEDLPAEVVNSMWLHLVMKRKQAAQKAQATRWRKSVEKRAREVEQTRSYKADESTRVRCEELEGSEEDEYAASGF